MASVSTCKKNRIKTIEFETTNLALEKLSVIIYQCPVIEESCVKMIKVKIFSLFLGYAFGKFIHAMSQTEYDIIKDLVQR